MNKLILFSLFLFLSPGLSNLQAQEKKASDNQELQELYEKDQAERMVSNPDWRVLVHKDSLRRKQVRVLLDSGKVQTAKDFYHAAMIFQHGTDTIDSGMAVRLMRKAIARDSTMNKWLLAAAIDRDLMRKGEPQIYGTQYVKNGADKPFELYQLDSTKITDAERKEYNVRTLAEQREQLLLMNKKSLLQLAAEGKTATEIALLVRENPTSEEYNIGEEAVNSLGYFFISKKDYLQALSIFELNVELYPEAFNTHDSHGEVLLLLGREKEAVEAYKRSLELNPENENAREVLEKTRA